MLASKLQSIGDRRNDHKRETYRAILRRARRRLLFYARGKNATYCVYTIPIWLPHRPLYDPSKATKYVSTKLRKEGLRVTPLTPNQIFVSWRSDDGDDGAATSSSSNKRKKRASLVVPMLNQLCA